MRTKIYICSFLALTFMYAGLSLGLASDPSVLHRYHITQSHAHLVNVGVVIPLICIWLAALYGSVRFKLYAKSIVDTPEGYAFSKLATGLTVLAFSLPFLACVSSLLNYIGWHSVDLLPTITITKNYLTLFFQLLAFLYIYSGTAELITTIKRKTNRLVSNWALIGIICLTTTYVWLIVTRTMGTTGDTAYFLPNWIIFSTLAVPYLFIWCKGIQSAFYIYRYQTRIRGTVYKRSLQSLAHGIITIIISSIFIQMITTSAARLSRLNLTPLLGIVYLLILLYAVGYGLVARGAKKLELIEEV